MRGGVYAYRTRRPSGLGRHWAYVGQTSSFWHRHRQHVGYDQGYRDMNGVRWVPGQPWADLKPTVYRIPLPNWLWLRLTVETLLIMALWPVYNVQKNRWNPRRITPAHARAQRFDRDGGRVPIANIIKDIIAIALVVTIACLWIWVIIHVA